MKITFLYHSSFLVELDTCTLLFDWYGGTVPDYDRSRPLYVFNSHHHGDHYSPEIFTALGMDNVWYILGSCIRLSAKRKAGIVEEQVFRLGAGHTLTLGPLQIQTLPSTDAGVAFLVEAEGRTLFHAGDLNWWHWAGEPDPWNPNMERDFKAYTAPLQGREIDVAFLVLDSRQGDAYWWGFDWMMRTFQAKAAFPMHSWEDFPIVQRLKRRPESRPYRDRIKEIYYNGQNFTLEG